MKTQLLISIALVSKKKKKIMFTGSISSTQKNKQLHQEKADMAQKDSWSRKGFSFERGWIMHNYTLQSTHPEGENGLMISLHLTKLHSQVDCLP